MTANDNRPLIQRLGLTLAALDAALVVLEDTDQEASRKRLIDTARRKLDEAHELLLKIQTLLGQIK
jgi:hypothetical protein